MLPHIDSSISLQIKAIVKMVAPGDWVMQTEEKPLKKQEIGKKKNGGKEREKEEEKNVE